MTLKLDAYSVRNIRQENATSHYFHLTTKIKKKLFREMVKKHIEYTKCFVNLFEM